MTTIMYSHPACVEHDPGPMHPECPDRLHSVLAGLDGPNFKHLVRIEAPKINLKTVEMIHGPPRVS